MVVYGFAVFSGAFLLFLMQPLIGKYLLPWFGGTPSVWTACLLVFQVLLLAGYSYAYLSTRFLRQRAQVVLHLVLIILAGLLPITPNASWRPVTASDPTLRICWLLLSCLGLPFAVLSATAPLLQHWFGRTQTKTSPFLLYSLSNAGSELALLSYPVFFETFFGRATQVLLWRAGLGLFALSCAWAGLRVWKAAPASGPDTRAEKVPAPTIGERILWVLLSACGALLLSAVTNKLCQELAPVPLLWVLPLSLYLLSFIMGFSGFSFYDRRWFTPLLIVSLAIMTWMVSGQREFSVQAQALFFLAGFFVCCMVCHGEVFRLRPHPAHLPFFYLMLSAGGALGGAFVAVIAPRIFEDYFELHFGLMLCGGLFLLAYWREQRGKLRNPWRGLAWVPGSAALCVLGIVLWSAGHQNDRMRVYRSRNFYGVLNVYRHGTDQGGARLLELVHGRIAHGVQFLDPVRAQTPTLYYNRASGVGRAFDLLPAKGGRRIGVVGLGAGTVAAFARAGDQIVFYEINPEVERIAKNLFTFLKAGAGQVEVVPGDARLSLENEPGQNFDLLVLDAFNGDSIPLHLLTREAFVTYRRHTRPNGIIAVHISNRSLNLEPVLGNLARESGFAAQVIEQPLSNEAEGILPSTWMLLSQAPGFANRLASATSARNAVPASSKVSMWTDDYNGLFAVMRWRAPVESETSAPSGAEPPGILAKRSKAMAGIERFRKEIAVSPDSPVALNNLACLLATAGDPALRDGPQAVQLAERACQLTGYQNVSTLSTLAAAYAEVGRFEDAIATSEKACTLAGQKGESALLAGNRQMLEHFRQGQAFHQAEP